jgi:cyclohexadieny/prephenate dehydrogenase
MNNKLFQKVLIIGVGLIGSSIARALKNYELADQIIGYDIDSLVKEKCKYLKIVDEFIDSIIDSNHYFDLIIICSPLSTYKGIFESLNQHITQSCIITDVGSTKMSVIKDFENSCTNNYISLVPSHPIAGLEKSGPEYGFTELFHNRFCIITPFNKKNAAIHTVKKMWESFGMQVEFMDADRHDRVLAMTSHIPQLIAYSIVATATELEDHMRDEVIKYSAAGFRDFTRLAGSDPIMWRDVYSLNKDAVLEMLGRFTEDLTLLQKAIRNNDTQLLEKIFTSTREIRKLIEDAGQAGTFDPTESKKNDNA